MEYSKLNNKTALLTRLFALSVCLFFGAAHADIEPSGNGPELDSISSGTLYFESNGQSIQAPLLDTSLQIDVSGIVSSVEIKQTFHNTSTEWVEGHYVFPLPDQAAVNSLLVTIGDRKIVGTIKEKAEAKKQYEAAKREGRVAALVKQHRPNLFSTRFANIPPGESISISLGYVQTIAFDKDRFSLRIPLTITPRYSNLQNKDAVDITPPQVYKHATDSSMEIDHQLSISATLHGSEELAQVHSPSHSLRVVSTEHGKQMELHELSYLDRDFILEWRPAVSNLPVTNVWRENVNDEDYLLAMILPPTSNRDIPERARELLLVVDTSGSMAGEPIEAAKASLLSALSGLKPNDRFNIYEFNSNYSALFTEPQIANASNLELGRSFTLNLVSNGGTEMLPAVQAALANSQSDLLRQVVFITDGAVGYENSVIETVTHQLMGARLFTVGIGSAPNQWFMRKVAEAGRGSSHFIAEIGDAKGVMTQLLHKLESPALVDINIVFDDVSSDYVPNPVPDLYANEPVIVAAKLGKDASLLALSGQWGEELWDVSIDLTSAPMVNTGLSTLWAKRKIEALEDRQRLHLNPDSYKSDILQLALDHKLLSQYTSFIATEETPIRPSHSHLASKAIPNLMPHGSEMQAISFPQGAAGSDTRLLASILFALLAFALHQLWLHRLGARSL